MGKIISKTLIPLALTIVCLGPQISQAAEKCYETVLIPAQTDCRTSQSRSADFVSGCTVSPATTEQREVECPLTDRWVNVTVDTSYSPSGESMSHSQLCAAAGLTPSNIDGIVCASGDKPVMSGAGWESVVYKYGRQSSGRNGGFGVQGVAQADLEIEPDEDAGVQPGDEAPSDPVTDPVTDPVDDPAVEPDGDPAGEDVGGEIPEVVDPGYTYEGTMCITTPVENPGPFDALTAVVAVACR